MNALRTARCLDRYVGTLICFVFYLLNLFRFKRKPKTIKNILLIELFEMGAGIMAYPSIRYIKDTLQDPDIYFLSTRRTNKVWQLLKIIPPENILTIDDRNLFTFATSLIKQVFCLRKKKIDLAIDFELFMRISSIISFLVNPKLKAGFYKYGLEGLYRGNYYEFKCCYNQNTHISKNFLALTKTAISQSSQTPNYKGQISTSEITRPAHKSDPEMKKEVKAKIKTLYPAYTDEDIILVCPDVGKVLSVRNYPPPYFAEVIVNLLNRYPHSLFLLIGVKENNEICSFIKSKTNDPRCINFCDMTKSLDELLELMALSTLLIGNDNGPIHFASMTDLRILALFSVDSPFVYGPLGNCVILYSYFHCSPCVNAFNHKNTRCKNNLCLQAIKPEVVFEYSTKLIENKLQYRTINNKSPYI